LNNTEVSSILGFYEITSVFEKDGTYTLSSFDQVNCTLQLEVNTGNNSAYYTAGLTDNTTGLTYQYNTAGLNWTSSYAYTYSPMIELTVFYDTTYAI